MKVTKFANPLNRAIRISIDANYLYKPTLFGKICEDKRKPSDLFKGLNNFINSYKILGFHVKFFIFEVTFEEVKSNYKKLVEQNQIRYSKAIEKLKEIYKTIEDTIKVIPYNEKDGAKVRGVSNKLISKKEKVLSPKNTKDIELVTLSIIHKIDCIISDDKDIADLTNNKRIQSFLESEYKRRLKTPASIKDNSDAFKDIMLATIVPGHENTSIALANEMKTNNNHTTLSIRTPDTIEFLGQSHVFLSGYGYIRKGYRSQIRLYGWEFVFKDGDVVRGARTVKFNFELSNNLKELSIRVKILTPWTIINKEGYTHEGYIKNVAMSEPFKTVGLREIDDYTGIERSNEIGGLEIMSFPNKFGNNKDDFKYYLDSSLDKTWKPLDEGVSWKQFCDLNWDTKKVTSEGAYYIDWEDN